MRILLVDDHILFREGLASLLRAEANLQVVGEASTMQEAIEKSRTLKPDLILMDFSLPDGNGAFATHAILMDHPDTKIVFLTVHDEDERLFAAIQSGAKGYLLKNLPISKLVASLRSLETNQAALSREMTWRILTEYSRLSIPHAPEPSKLSDLTSREVEILTHLAEELTNREIADRLFLSETTVKNHIHNILTKLGLKNRYMAAHFARRQGLGKFAKSLD